MAVGLGFANPELRKAQLMAKLNGSTALPRNPAAPPPVDSDIQGGPSTAAPTTDVRSVIEAAAQAGARTAMEALANAQGAAAGPPQAAQPPATQPAAAPVGQPQTDPRLDPTGRGAKTPMWGKVAGALGHIILSADAGYHGRAMPSTPGYLDAEAEQDQDMRTAEFLINASARAWEIHRKAPAAARGPMLQQFKEAIQRVAPGFDLDGFISSMESDSEKADELAPNIATMSDDAKRMFMSQVNARGGNAQAAAETLKDDKFMKGLMDFEDGRNAAAIRYKGGALRQAMKQHGVDLGDTDLDGFMALNQQLPKRAQFTPSELGTIRRHPELARAMGLKGPEPQEQPTMDTRAGRQAPPQEPVAPASSDGPDPLPSARTLPRRPRPQAPIEPDGEPAAPPPQAPRQKPAPEPQAGGGDFLDVITQRADAERQRMQKGGVKAEEFVPKANAEIARRNQYQAETGAEDLSGYQEWAAKKGRGAKSAPPPASAPDQGQRFSVPRDMTLPGLGAVKKGDVVVYDPKSKKYRKG